MASLTTVSSSGFENFLYLYDYPVLSLSIDLAGDLFASSETGVFEIPFINGGYPNAPISLVGFAGPPYGLANGVSRDASGDLFGTVTGFGTDSGRIYEIPRVGVGYATSPVTLVTFNAADGNDPIDGVIVDASGNLFGTTNNNNISGNIYEIAVVNGNYATTPTILADFAGLGGGYATSGLIADAAGDLFGTASVGGAGGKSIVYELSKTPDGYASTPTVLYQGPARSLTLDSAGDLLAIGGENIIELAKKNGAYASTPETLSLPTALASPAYADVAGPANNPTDIIVDAAGNIFGTTEVVQVEALATTTLGEIGGSVFEIPKTANGYAAAITLAAFPTNYYSPFATPDLATAGGIGPSSNFVATSTGNLIFQTNGGTFRLVAFIAAESTIDELTNTGYATTPATATIMGADGVTRTLAFGLDALAKLAAPLLAGVAPASALFLDSAGTGTVDGGQTAAIDDSASAVTVTGGQAFNQTIAAGGGDFTFLDGGGAGTIVAGAGQDRVSLTGGGNWSVALGNGDDTVVASAGSDTIITGHASNLVGLGVGADVLVSLGTDTVFAGSGSATVSAEGGGDFVQGGGGALLFIGGTGANTVAGGAGAMTLLGGTSGGTLVFNNSRAVYAGNGASDTIGGGAGGITVTAGAGGGAFFGGTAGGNVITATSGNVTAIGGGAGDVLAATGAATNLFAGGAGAETLTGAGSTGANTFFAGTGPDTLIGGAGNTALVAGAGPDVLEGGGGVTLFLFAANLTNGAADTITGFDPTHDFVKLLGYSGREASVIANATVANGASTIALTDGTRVTFVGVAQLNSSSFN